MFSGELFDLPAGAVASAVGVEYRNYKIDDQPGADFADIWGSTTAGRTKGDEKVKEAFVELDVPVFKGVPGIESLSLNGSARVFKYDTVSGSDKVWKFGVNWQIIPSLRLRGTISTSYRAPGLYELYLGNQTGFGRRPRSIPASAGLKATTATLLPTAPLPVSRATTPPQATAAPPSSLVAALAAT